jgi:hypothetical protein
MQCLRVLVNGRNMEAQHTANQEPLVKFGNVPKTAAHICLQWRSAIRFIAATDIRQQINAH